MKHFLKGIVGYAEQFIITFFILCLIFTYILRIVRIEGDSMMNTFMDGDRVIINVMDKKVETGDTVIVSLENTVLYGENGDVEINDGLHETVAKRVIATAGQTINFDFSAGIVYLDGERLYEDYVESGLTHYDGGAFEYPVTVPDGYVFIMGDNRSVSLDSRSDKIGFVPVEDITGTVLLKFHPEFELLS